MNFYFVYDYRQNKKKREIFSDLKNFFTISYNGNMLFYIA